MSTISLDHVNIRTENLADLSDFYTRILGLEAGWRPGFESKGIWLYGGEIPIVHLVEVEQAAKAVGRIEHFALRGEDKDAFVKHLVSNNIDYTVKQVPDIGSYQFNVHDPDGNRVEILFK